MSPLMFSVQQWQELSFTTGYSAFFQMCDSVEGVFNQTGGNTTIPGAEGVGLRKAINGFASYIRTQFVPGYCARVDRAAVLRLDGFNWNCPQHIPQRFTLDELDDALAPVRARMAALEEENRALQRRLSGA